MISVRSPSLPVNTGVLQVHGGKYKEHYQVKSKQEIEQVIKKKS